MQHRVTADVAADPSRVFEIVSDLGTYPRWLDLVVDAVDDSHNGDEQGPAWLLTLRARVGPLARSKRLRMARTEHSDSLVVFERSELDGRQHAAWRMEAAVDEGPKGAIVELDLQYDGSLWDKPLELVLASAVDRAGPQLSEYAGS